MVTYAVPASRFEGLFPDRFVLGAVEIDGQAMGLISVVPFIGVDFTSAVLPFPKFTRAGGETCYAKIPSIQIIA